MAKDVRGYTAQLEAMGKIMQALEPLDKAERESVLDWVDTQVDRLRIKGDASGQSMQSQAAAHGAVETETGRAVRPGTVSTVAQKLGANSCRTLLIAAAAHLTLFQGRDSFTRDELIGAAKQARGWKAEYSNQMATAIVRLQDSGTLFEKSKDVFSLSDQAVTDLDGKLAF